MKTLVTLGMIAFVLSATTAPADPGDGSDDSPDRIADAARDAANEHASFLRQDDPDAATPPDVPSEIDRMCDVFDTHGEYVSGVANETRAAENASGIGATVSEAARTDIGKCGGADEDGVDNETADVDDEADEEPEDSDRGRSEGAREEHPPANEP